MTIGENLKKVRKALDLTQQKFADQIGTTQNNIASYEIGRREPSAAAINNICKTFNVNEVWLRTGKGEMLNPTPETSIDEIVRDYGLDDLDRQIIMEYIQLSDSDRKTVKRYIQRIALHIQQAPPLDKALEQEADEFAAIARQQFISEKKRESQILSVNEFDSA